MKFEISKHIALQIKDFAQALKHYQEVMGMTLISRTENYAVLQSGEIIFHLEGDLEGGKTFFDYKVEDLEAAKSLLEAKNCRLFETTSDHGKSYLVHDPFGMSYLIYQEQA